LLILSLLLKATSVVPKVSESAGVGINLQIFNTVYSSFQKPVHVDIGGFQKFVMTASGFLSLINPIELENTSSF
jgi:hypothetical protein